MGIALGIHVGAYEASAVLVESTLPDLGPVASRTVSSIEAPGGIVDAAIGLLQVMQVQAAQNDVRIVGSAVVCDDVAQRDIVDSALATRDISGVEVLAVGDSRLNSDYPSNIAAALVGNRAATKAPNGRARVGRAPAFGRLGSTRAVRPAMVGLGVGVSVALSGAVVWALTSTGSAEGSVDGTAESIDATGSVSSAVDTSIPSVGAGDAGWPSASTLPPAVPGAFEGNVNGVAAPTGRSEAPPEGAIATWPGRDLSNRSSDVVLPPRGASVGVETTIRRPRPATEVPPTSGSPSTGASTGVSTPDEPSPPETPEPSIDPGDDPLP